MQKNAINFAKTLLAVGFSCFFCFIVFFNNTALLSKLDGERTFYLYSPSSQATIITAYTPATAPFVRGESVRFARNGADESTLLQTLVNEYGASLVAVEKTDGVTSYYLHTSKWFNGVMVGGASVNLHLAVGDEYCVVGTPIIFGGY